MPSFAFAPVVALAAVLGAVATAPAHVVSPYDVTVPLLAPGAPIPATQFLDQDDARVTFGASRGYATAIAFIYTRCRDTCPIVTAKFARASQELGDAKIRLVEVTIDPAHDTPAVLAAYAHGYGAHAPQWRMLTGSPADVERFARALGVQAVAAGGDEIIHNDHLVLVKPDGTIAQFVDGSSWTPSDLVAQLRAIAGQPSSPIARIDLALGAALAFCGGAISGRAGIGDLAASVAVIALGAFVFWRLVRRLSAAA